MKERCATCAYRPGTEASRDETTLLTARLCAIAGEPFFCHEEQVSHGEERQEVCAGFLAAVEAQGPEPEWRRDVADGMLRLMEEAAEHPADFDTDAKAAAKIRAVLGLD